MEKQQAPERIALVSTAQDTQGLYENDLNWVALPDELYNPEHHPQYVRSDIHEAALRQIAQLKAKLQKKL